MEPARDDDGPVIDDDPIVMFLAHQRDPVRRLLVAHIDDGSGHCRVCTIGNQAGYLVWPCTIVGYAIRASRISPPLPTRRW